MFLPTLEAARITIKLLDKYKDRESITDVLKPEYNYVSPEEHLQQHFEQNDYTEELKELVVEFFFKVIKYRKYLSIIIEELFVSKSSKGIPNDFSLHLVILYLLIIELNKFTKDKIENLLLSLNDKKTLSLLIVLKKSNTLTKLYEWGCRLWDVNYVKEILQNVIEEPLFQEVYETISYQVQKVKKSQKKNLTIPIGPKCLTRIKKFEPKAEPRAPCPEGFPPITKIPIYIKANKVPSTTYARPTQIERIEIARLRNREKAVKLLEEANKMAFNCSNLEKSEKFYELKEKIEKERDENFVKLSFKKVKIKDMVCPKKTAAVILREGARLLKLEQEEIKRFENLASGGFNSDLISEWEEEVREEAFRKRLQDIEKKHLEGLLSYEEALLAKQKCFKKKKESADAFRREKENWLKQLEEWRSQEQLRIQENIERGKAFEKGAKEAVEFVKEEKHKLALEITEESKTLRERWLKENEEELQRKVQLIKEIKALQTFGVLKKKQMDFTESSNMGLLCEMSIAELRERLFLLKIELQEELVKKRAEIKTRRECRKGIIESYQELIESHQKIIKEQKECLKNDKPKKEKKEVNQRSSSLESLRRKLYEKRMERIKY